jgi:hypothetical protein
MMSSFFWTITATLLGDWCPTFRHGVMGVIKGLNHQRRIVLIYSFFFGDGFWKMRPTCSLETSGTNHPVTRRHIPEERRPQMHRCEGLKACIRSNVHSQFTTAELQTAQHIITNSTAYNTAASYVKFPVHLVSLTKKEGLSLRDTAHTEEFENAYKHLNGKAERKTSLSLASHTRRWKIILKLTLKK